MGHYNFCVNLIDEFVNIWFLKLIGPWHDSQKEPSFNKLSRFSWWLLTL